MNSELADLFELMHDAPGSFRTLRATTRTWGDSEVASRASDRWMEQARNFGAVVATMGTIDCCTVGDDSWESFEQVWVERPDRLRREAENETTVRNGSTQWSYYPHSGAYETQPDAIDEGERALPSPLPGMAEFGTLEIIGEEVVAGRRGLSIRAQPRPVSGPPLPFGPMPSLARGADECVFVVDRERGFLLRTDSRLDGQSFAVTEFTELEFDTALDPQVFVFVPPPGAHVHTAQEIAAERRGFLTLERVAAQASFTVYAPALVWPRATMHVSYMPAQELSELEEQVSLFYSDFESDRSLIFSESTAGMEPLPDGDWERVELDGVEAFVGTPADLPFRSSERGVETPLIVRLVRENTQIEVQGWGLEQPELVGFVRMLKPARTGPPPGFR